MAAAVGGGVGSSGSGVLGDLTNDGGRSLCPAARSYLLDLVLGFSGVSQCLARYLPAGRLTVVYGVLCT